MCTYDECLSVLHTYNIKRHLPGPEAVRALLPSLLLLLWFSLPSISHLSLSYIVIASFLNEKKIDNNAYVSHTTSATHTIEYDHIIKHT